MESGRETRRRRPLHQLGEVLHKLDLKQFTDTEAFFTGPRRSVALQSFVVRPNENYVGMRNRMSIIVAALANAEVEIGDSGTRIWAGFSKTRVQRLNGGHSAWVRRTVRAVASKEETWLETDYANGVCWLRGERISSAVEEAKDPETPKELN